VDQLTAGNHDLRVEYYEAGGFAGVQVTWTSSSGGGTTTTTGTDASAGGAANWNAQYFNNNSLSGNPAITRTDGRIDFNWAGGSPDGAIPADNFSARWTATVNFPTPGHWKFRVGADDAVRMWIDATLIVDKWQTTNAFNVYEVDLYELTAGNHDLKVEYFEATGLAGAQVSWSQPGGTGAGAALAAAAPPPVKVIAAVTANSLYVRTGPGEGYPSFTRIFYPRGYLVLGAVPDMSWVKIDLGNGQQGWVTNDWVYLYSDSETANMDNDADTYPDFVFMIPRIYDVPVLPGAYTPVIPGPVTVRGYTTADVQVRDGATLASKVIAFIPFAGQLNIEARNRNGAWYLVTYQGLRGWVSSPFVKLTEGRVSDLVVSTEVVPAPPAGQIFIPESPSGQPVTVRGQLRTDGQLRDAASVRGQIVTDIPQGTELVIEGRNTTGAWYLVTFNGVQGWVYSPNVRLIEGSVRYLQIR
jgi:uncharacterized protein YgiM (DUF1202 family)